MSTADHGEVLAVRIRAALPEFRGFPVRVDAGEEDLVFVALRGAKREEKAGEALAEAVDKIVGAYLKEVAPQGDFGIIMGRGNRDLLLRVEIRL